MNSKPPCPPAKMSGEAKATTNKSKPRRTKEDRNRTYFTKNNSRFISRRIPTIEEMILERNYQIRPKHVIECKLHTSWTSILSPDIYLSEADTSDGGKRNLNGQISPSTVSFATLYRGTSTAKSTCKLPAPYEKNPYQKYILEQKRLAEKCLNVDEEQLETLEKENEEEINKIAEQFCNKVRSWDEEDTTVAEALQSLNVPDGGNPSEAVAQGTLQQDEMEKLVITKDLSHLTNPEWVSNLFRICFGTPWSDGFSKVLKEQEGTNNVCKGLGITVTEMRQGRIKPEKIQADRKLKREAAKPKVAFSRTVPRAKGLEDYEKPSRTPSQRLYDRQSKKQQDLQMDLVTMRAIWGNQINSRSTKHYCSHLRELIKQKLDGTIDPSLAAVTLPQMKPKVLLDAGMLSLDYPETTSTSSSLSSSSSLDSSPLLTAQKKK